MQTVIDKFDHRSTRSVSSKDKNSDAAFFVGGGGHKNGQKPLKDLECYNCHKKGHRKADCWAKGGGKEGQGLRSRDRKGRAGDLKSVIHVKKLNQTGMDRMGLRSEAMSWARRNRDVGESEMSC